MLIIKNKDSVAEKLKLVARQLKYTTRMMKHQTDDTKVIENIIACEQLLGMIIEEDTAEIEKPKIEYVYLQ